VIAWFFVAQFTEIEHITRLRFVLVFCRRIATITAFRATSKLAHRVGFCVPIDSLERNSATSKLAHRKSQSMISHTGPACLLLLIAKSLGKLHRRYGSENE
jgi:hypothetical protein